jgi:hypothetical protein
VRPADDKSADGLDTLAEGSAAAIHAITGR